MDKVRYDRVLIDGDADPLGYISYLPLRAAL